MFRRRSLAALSAFLVSVASATLAAERSYPIDCLPDRVVTWNASQPDPDLRFGAPFLPGVVLGPPGNSVAFDGSTSVASLGFAGSVVLQFEDIVIEDRPGPDFIVFENAFFAFPPPATDTDDFRVFVEPAFVEVSADGISWALFPHDPAALAQVTALNVDRALYLQLDGLAGVTPTFSGNWTVAEDREVFDPTGEGGVSGAGGDAFDLADVGLTEARYIRITDADTQVGFPGAPEGFDLDGVVALHARPEVPTATDSDGDGLSDLAETALYGSDPLLPDSDSDGVDDGREVAGCRDPGLPGTDPYLHREPRLWVRDADCTELRWTFLGSGLVHDVIRGQLDLLSPSPGQVDLGPVDCLGQAETTPLWSSCDLDVPSAGTVFIYAVQVRNENDFGRSSSLDPREAPAACP